MDAGFRAEAATAESRRFAETADFMCLICHEIAWDATACSECSKLFCSSCINHWIDMQEIEANCPGCRASGLFLGVRTGGATLAPVKKLLNKIQLKCPRNCPWVGDYWDAHSHSQFKCPEIPVTCEDCSTVSTRGKIEQHRENCPNKPVSCHLCSSGKFKPDELAEHQLKTCTHVIVNCEACKWSGIRLEEQDHKQTCLEIVITCDIEGCTDKFKRSDKSTHDKENAQKHVQILRELVKHLKNTRKRFSTSETLFDPIDVEGTLEDNNKPYNHNLDRKHREMPCTTQPKCPYNGTYDLDRPFGQRCIACNRARKKGCAKVPCLSGIAPDCWKTIYKNPDFPEICRPCREFEI
jgi:hypothetical protein